MKTIGDILSNIARRFSNEKEKAATVRAIIHRQVGIELSSDALVIKKTHARLTTLPTMKMAILLKKDAIIAECKQQGIDLYSIG